MLISYQTQLYFYPFSRETKGTAQVVSQSQRLINILKVIYCDTLVLWLYYKPSDTP